MRAPFVKPLAIAAAGAVALAAACFGFPPWRHTPTTEAVAARSTEQALPRVVDDAAAGLNQPAQPTSAPAGGLRPQPTPTRASPAADPRIWSRERTAFLADKGFAASIQKALSDPTAAGLFYALQAVDRCSNLRSIGVGASAVREMPALANLVETCREALALNGNQLEFFAKFRAARLGASDQAILDAADGKGSAKDMSIAQRFAIVAPTDDALLLGEVGAAWLRSPNASYAGSPLSDESRLIFQEAWALATCEATASCETSIGSVRLCSVQHKCDGTLRSRLHSVMSAQTYEALAAYADAVASALQTKDFSGFN